MRRQLDDPYGSFVELQSDSRIYLQRKLYKAPFLPLSERSRHTVVFRSMQLEQKNQGFNFNAQNKCENLARQCSERFAIDGRRPCIELTPAAKRELQQFKAAVMFVHYYSKEDAEEAVRRFYDDAKHSCELLHQDQTSMDRPPRPSPESWPDRNRSYRSDSQRHDPNPRSIHRHDSMPQNYRNNDPNPRNHAPNYRNNDPTYRNHDPNYRNNDSNYRNNDSSYRNNDSIARSNDPNYRNHDPSARSNDPIARSNEPIARNDPIARSNEPNARINDSITRTIDPNARNDSSARINDANAQRNDPNARSNDPNSRSNEPICRNDPNRGSTVETLAQISGRTSYKDRSRSPRRQSPSKDGSWRSSHSNDRFYKSNASYKPRHRSPKRARSPSPSKPSSRRSRSPRRRY
ncbi:hypothetical protein THRCLA_01511 [Thraustotheca clavata]|uniref:Uncharacterized protein n=1 Tax=Thraustotheca clavata TaxID=74557 RepID=A0A1W0A8F6_9STRA|nr:hypothetical protein THRCLA_01511 [Thraustotheca clavata]